MSIQHKDIADALLHEPKGVISAPANSVYRANGSGSGVWTKIQNTDLQGLVGDGGSANKKVTTNGTLGFNLKADAVYGAMAVSGNTNGFTVTAAADSSLNTNSDYALFTGTGAPWASENLNELTFNTNRLILPYTGVYELNVWAGITGFPTTAAFVAFKYRINGTTFGPRKTKTKSNVAGDVGSLTTLELFQGTAGDFIQLYVASSAAGSLVISDLNVTVQLVNQTA